MTIAAAERAALIKLVALMFDAAPGATYLDQVVRLYESLGHDLDATAHALAGVQQFTTLHRGAQTQEEFTTKFLTPLGLEDDAGARAFVIDRLEAGLDKGSIAAAALHALEHLSEGAASQYTEALAILSNKAAVAEYYSVQLRIDETDLNLLQQVLTGVTADSASVVQAQAEIDAGTRGVRSDSNNLKTSQDTFVGTVATDIVHGTFGSGPGVDTLTPGDSIDGGAGSDMLKLTATGTVANHPVMVKNVEKIQIQDTVGATFDALLVQDGPAITVTDTVAGNTSTIMNAPLASSYGLSGTGNLSVAFTGTSGSADTAILTLGGVGGTGSAAASAINVASGNSIERISIATSGINNIALTGGTAAAALDITGSGTNTVNLSGVSALAASATVDATASTGTNTFAMGSNFGSGTTIKGGSGADTVSATIATGTQLAPKLSGVETLSTTWTAYGVLNLAATSGVKSISIDDKGAGGTLTLLNAPSSVATVAVTEVKTANDNLSFSYGSATTGDLALVIGSASATASAVDLGSVTLGNVASVSVSTLGAKNHDMDGMAIKGAPSLLAFSVAAGGALSTGGATVSGNVGALQVTVAAGSSYEGSVVGSARKSLGDTDIVANGNAAAVDLQILDFRDAGSLRLTQQGNQFEGQVVLDAAGGIGEVAMELVGRNNSLDAAFLAEDGDIGNITLQVSGNGSEASLAAYAGLDYTYDAGKDVYRYDGGGNVGNLDVSVHGRSFATLNVGASGGAVGDIRIDVGTGGRVSLGAGAQAAEWLEGAPDSAGDIGDISVMVGARASFSGIVIACGGDIGRIDVDVHGGDGSFQLWAHAEGGSIGDVAVSIAGDDAFGAMRLEAQRSGGDDESGGDIGAVDITIGDDAKFLLAASVEGSLGAVNVVAGDDAAFTFSAGGEGDIGDVNWEAGANTEFNMFVSGASSVGTVTLAGGDARSTASVSIKDGSVGAIDGIYADAWAGDLSIDLRAVGQADVPNAVGTTVQVGTGGSQVRGTEGADVIFLGSGKDIVRFDASIDGDTQADTVLDFAVGGSRDVLDIASFVGSLGAVLTGNPATTAVDSGDILRLVDIAGGDDLTTAAGLAHALGSGEYGSVDVAHGAHLTVLTATSSSSTSFYVFDVNDAAEDGVTAADVTLLGIVHTTGGTLASLALENFA